jgi:hypothetical protein
MKKRLASILLIAGLSVLAIGCGGYSENMNDIGYRDSKEQPAAK